MSAGNDREFIDHLQEKEGGKAMKCPLSITGELTAEKEFIGAAADCLKEECAWWDDVMKRCVMKTVGAKLSGINLMVHSIEDKMPTAMQFLQKP